MQALFFIEIPAYTSELFSWYKKSPDSDEQGENTLAEIAPKTLNCAVVLIFSGLNITQNQITSTLKNRKKLETAIAYELEEQLSAELETLFFAYHANKAKKVLDVEIMNRAWFENWLTQCKQQGIKLTAATTDTILLQTLAHDYLLICKTHDYLLKTPDACYVIDAENSVYFFKHLKTELPEQLPLLAYTEQVSDFAEFITSVAPQPIEKPLLAFLTANYQIEGSFNLLQGAYKSNFENHWRLLKIGIACVFSVLLFATAFQKYQHWELTQLETQLTEKREQLFHKSFPAVKRIINPLAQMKNEIKALQQAQTQQSHFMGLLGQLSLGLRDMLAQQKLTVSAIEFQNDVLSLRFNCASFAIVEQIKAVLVQQRLTIEIESEALDKANNQVNAVFKIKAGEA